TRPALLSTLSLHDALPIFRCLQPALELVLCLGGSMACPGDQAGGGAARLFLPSWSGMIDERSAQTPGFIGGVGASSPCSTPPARSEEHTSELQSLAYLVCR